MRRLFALLAIALCALALAKPYSWPVRNRLVQPSSSPAALDGGQVYGTGVAGQVTYWGSAHTLTGDPGLTWTVDGGLSVYSNSTSNNNALVTLNAGNSLISNASFMLLGEMDGGRVFDVDLTPKIDLLTSSGTNLASIGVGIVNTPANGLDFFSTPVDGPLNFGFNFNAIDGATSGVFRACENGVNCLSLDNAANLSLGSDDKIVASGGMSGSGAVTISANGIDSNVDINIVPQGTGQLNISTPLRVGNGGTGAVTANVAFNNLAPSQAGNSGKFLTTNGTNTSWGTVSTGVTTVGAFSGSSQANGASISSSTITFGPADGTNPGMVSTGAQVIAGAKEFTSSMVIGAAVAPTSVLNLLGAVNSDGIVRTILQLVNNNDAYNTTPQVGFNFDTKYNSNGDLLDLGSIQMGKENTTSGDSASFMQFITRQPGSVGTFINAMRLTSGGRALFNSTSDNGVDEVQVVGSSTQSGTMKSTVAAASDAMENTEGALVTFNGSAATTYIKGDTSTHGLDFFSASTSGDPAFLFSAPGTDSANLARFKNGTTTELLINNNGAVTVNDGYQANGAAAGYSYFQGSGNRETRLIGSANANSTQVVIDSQNANTTGKQLDVRTAGVSIASLDGTGYLASATPSYFAIFPGTSAVANNTAIGGQVLPARAMTVTGITFDVSVAGTGGVTGLVISSTDGTNTCTMTKACTGTGPFRVAAVNGAGTGCAYAASASITYKIDSTSDCTLYPVLLGVADLEEKWQ